ncbi:MAG: hypothetical protein AB9836_06160 [Aminipila sp.]
MHSRKPTRREKVLISSYGLQPLNWLVSKTSKDKLILVHRHTNRERVIPEGIR